MKRVVDARVTVAALFGLAMAAAACSGGRGIVPASSGVGPANAYRVAAKGSCIKGWTGSGGVPFEVVDESGLTEKGSDSFDLYVTVNDSTQYLDPTTGALDTLTSTPIAPIPIERMCPDFKLPPGSASRAYLSFGPLSVTNKPPNPKSPQDPNNGVLYDWMEFGTPAGSVYNFQADMFALPLQANMTDGGKKPYAFGYNDYLGVVSTFSSEPWKSLVVCGKVGTNHNPECPAGKFVVRVQAPGTASAPGGTGFPSYWNADGSSYLKRVGEAFNDAPKGGNVYVAYQISYPNPNSDPKGIVQGCGNFPSGTAGLPCPGYIARYDVADNAFVFNLASPVPVEWSPTPDQAFPKTVTLPIATYFSDYDIWAQPAPAFVPSTPPPSGGTPPPVSSLPMKEQVTFYLLKDMYVDLNRGVAMKSGTAADPVFHPLLPACMPNPIAQACSAKNYYTEAKHNFYSRALHAGSVDIYAVTSGDPLPKVAPGTAYGFPYDDTWSQSSSVTPGSAITCLQVRILPMAGQIALAGPKARTAPPICARQKRPG